MWLFTKEEFEDRYPQLREGGHYEDTFPLIAKAALRKVARILEEHAAVSARGCPPGGDWLVPLPRNLIKCLFAEAGLVQENTGAKTD